MPGHELGEPVGAIWAKNWKLLDSLTRFLGQTKAQCSFCHQVSVIEIDQKALNEAIKAHTLAVKVKILKEKFIAVQNTRKKSPTQPDYFIHVYQTHTGAAPSYPFGSGGKA